MKLGCIVMASGSAVRFGANKLLEPFGGRPLLAHTLGHLPLDRLERVVVVSVHQEVARLAQEAGFSCVAPKGPGKHDTIRAGILEMAGMDGCMFCVGDQPLCRESTMRMLLDRFASAPDQIARLYAGERPGNPVIFPAALFEELASLPANEGGSLLVKRYPGRLLAVQAEFSWELDDADTPEKLRQLEERWIASSSKE